MCVNDHDEEIVQKASVDMDIAGKVILLCFENKLLLQHDLASKQEERPAHTCTANMAKWVCW